jgi:hypothetical protein
LLGTSIVKYFQENHHRFAILLFDCCNENISPGPYASVRKNENVVITGNKRLPGLKTLFLKARGILIGSSASPGEFSLCDHHGGTFTNGFLHALDNKCFNQHISWNDIFPKVTEYCLKNNPKEYPQHPVFRFMP